MIGMPRNVVELLRLLIRIPSVNPAGTPGTAEVGEQKCAEAVAEFLRACGAHVEMETVKPSRPNVIGILPSGAGSRKDRVVFAPHTDTVSVSGMTIDPFGGELREGKIYGRGASDTKGSMAAMLWAIYEMRERMEHLSHEIWFAGLMGEETGQDGSRNFVANHRAEFALVGEPTDLQIVHVHKGALWLSITTQGKACHASAPGLGENAIYKMADIIRCIRDEIAHELASISESLLGSPTVNVGTCHGGSKVNIVPDRCHVEVDFRTLPSQDAEQLATGITARLRRIDPSVTVTRSISNALFTNPSHPMIQALRKAGGECRGASWFCDAAIFAQAGIPAVAAGPGSIAQAHTEDEWIAVSDLEAGVEFYKRFLDNL